MLKIILALGVGFFLGQLVLFLLMYLYVKKTQRQKLYNGSRQTIFIKNKRR